jgi:hypothetical protein
LASLDRVQLEAEPEHSTAPEGLDPVGVKRARPGAGVDLRLDGVDMKVGQAHPRASRL